MNIKYNKLLSGHQNNWLYRSIEALFHPKIKFRFILSKTAVVLAVISLTAVTLTSHVAAAADNTSSVVSQTGSNDPISQPNGTSKPEQTPPVEYLANTADAGNTVLLTLMKAEETNTDISAFLNLAAEQIGKPYVFGRTGPKSFDCSGLVYYCLNQAGLSVSRTTASGFSKDKDWEKITSMDDLKPGDIMFFSTGGKNVGHTGIYIGNGEMIDASSSNGEVVQRSCVTSYWKNHFVFARRPF